MKLYNGLLVSLCLAGPLMGTAHALDISQIYSLALEQDIELSIARSQLQSVTATLIQAESAGKPQVNLTASTSYQDKDNSLSGDDTQTSLAYTLNLQQNIYNTEVSARSDAASANIRQAEAEYKLAQQNLILRVTEAYFNILSAKDSVAFAQAEKKAIARQLEQANKRFEVGLIAITDVKEAQASYDLSVSQEIVANNALDNARVALQVIIGQPLAESLSSLGDKLDMEIPPPVDGKQWVELAKASNLSLISSQARLEAANENRKIARSGEKPTVDFLASYQGVQGDSDKNGSFDTGDLAFSLQLNMPLYTSGRTGGAIEQAEADYATAQNNLMLQKRLIAQQTSTAYLAVVAGIAQVNALKQALNSTTAALDATQAGFDVGTRTSVDVLNSLRETYRSRRDYASARYDFLVNTLKLKQAAGILQGEDISALNQWLTP